MQDLMMCDPFPAPHSVYGLETFDPWSSVSPEQRAFASLPPMLQEVLLDECAENEDFLGYYIIPTLRTRNPYETFMGDFGRAMAEDGVYVGQLGDLGSLKKRLKKAAKKVGKAVKKVSKVIHTPAMKVFKSVSKTTKKVWRKYGNIIIGVAGAVLAPFTGGASLAAAAALSAANTAYMTKRAADQAKKMAKADAAALAAQAAEQEAALLVQVDQFYNDNRAWFEQYGITPDKWAQLTLDQKIDLINAGAKGTLPTGIGPVVGEGDAPPAPGAPTGGAPMPPTGMPPGYIMTPMGPAPMPSGPPGAAPPPESAAPTAPPAAEPEPPKGFTVVIEGQPVGTFHDMNEAMQAALNATRSGDRFEIMNPGGQSMGLHVRTSEGSSQVPPEMEADVRKLSVEQMRQFVADAEAKLAAKKKGGFPWWLLLVGGAVAAAAA